VVRSEQTTNASRANGGESVSVVICAYTESRWNELVKAVSSVESQTRRPDETIVVIDHNPALLERARQTFTGATVIPNRAASGLSGARNSGVAVARGEIVAFLDDDAQADQGWLAELLSPYRDPTVVGTGGSVEPRWSSGHVPRWLPREFYWTIGCGYTGLPTEAAAIRNPIGANMSFRRETIRQVGGFREGVGRVGAVPLGCEETELALRVTAASPTAKIMYAPGARVDHLVTPERARWRYFRARCRAEGRSKAAVVKHAGAQAGLASERSYVSRTLPEGVLRELSLAVRGDLWGAVRAATIVAGLFATGAGYLYGLALRTSGGSLVGQAGARGDASAPSPIPVLLYHRIAAADDDRFAVTPERFSQHVRLIAASGRTPVTIGELADGIQGKRPLPARPVAVTIDDAYEDTPRAVAESVANGLSVTVYVTTGTLDRPGMLSTSQLRALAAMGPKVELGAHSDSHAHLDALEQAEVRRELRTSKRHLEQLMRRPVETFAYPHGSYDDAVRAAVIDAGYRSATAVKNAISHPDDDPWAIARYTVTSATTMGRLADILDGRSAPLAWRRERLRTWAARTARRLRRRVAQAGR
jgi:peptidoglycan/xylan/chitin deacetylase (PgdA/CDA1 family)/GT2 family glycosyltransferase